MMTHPSDPPPLCVFFLAVCRLQARCSLWQTLSEATRLAINTWIIAEALLAASVFTYWTWTRRSTPDCSESVCVRAAGTRAAGFVFYTESISLVLDVFCFSPRALWNLRRVSSTQSAVFWTERLWETFGEVLPVRGWPERCPWYVSTGSGWKKLTLFSI